VEITFPRKSKIIDGGKGGRGAATKAGGGGCSNEGRKTKKESKWTAAGEAHRGRKRENKRQGKGQSKGVGLSAS